MIITPPSRDYKVVELATGVSVDKAIVRAQVLRGFVVVADIMLQFEFRKGAQYYNIEYKNKFIPEIVEAINEFVRTVANEFAKSLKHTSNVVVKLVQVRKYDWDEPVLLGEVLLMNRMMKSERKAT